MQCQQTLMVPFFWFVQGPERWGVSVALVFALFKYLVQIAPDLSPFSEFVIG